MSVETPESLESGVWHTVQIDRNGRRGSLTLNGQEGGEMTSSGGMDKLSVVGPLYVGGFPGTPPYQSVTPVNFTGCIEEVSLFNIPIFYWWQQRGNRQNKEWSKPPISASKLMVS